MQREACSRPSRCHAHSPEAGGAPSPTHTRLPAWHRRHSLCSPTCPKTRQPAGSRTRARRSHSVASGGGKSLMCWFLSPNHSLKNNSQDPRAEVCSGLPGLPRCGRELWPSRRSREAAAGTGPDHQPRAVAPDADHGGQGCAHRPTEASREPGPRCVGTSACPSGIRRGRGGVRQEGRRRFGFTWRTGSGGPASAAALHPPCRGGGGVRRENTTPSRWETDPARPEGHTEPRVDTESTAEKSG